MKNKNNGRLLFKYTVAPTTNVVGDINPITKVLNIFYDSIIIYEEYDFLHKTKVSEQIFSLDENVTNQIEGIIEENWNVLSSIPENLCNGSMDGSFNDFEFKTIKIHALNIKKSNLEILKKCNIDYYNKYKKNIGYENIVMEVFGEIEKVLKKQKITLLERQWI